ncbi:MAG: putative zinc-binding peptidase, partial [Bryobacteraceae bacterium]
MKLFTCQHCAQLLYFENRLCQCCSHLLGYLPATATLSALAQDDDAWRPLAELDRRYRFCANAQYDACNWLVSADAEEVFCVACRHNRTIPDLSVDNNLNRWRKFELAKHRLFYTLIRLGLPLPSRSEDPKEGLVFDFLANGPDTGHKVMTGHEDGQIVINLAEADDDERVKLRLAMNEPYRTLLGHFRHESGHYFWDRLVRDGERVESFRELFGDERQDYQQALHAHYSNGPARNWQQSYISSYAAAHPWEDFAETWAHYLHIVDTLEMAFAYGIRIQP